MGGFLCVFLSTKILFLLLRKALSVSQLLECPGNVQIGRILTNSLQFNC